MFASWTAVPVHDADADLVAVLPAVWYSDFNVNVITAVLVTVADLAGPVTVPRSTLVMVRLAALDDVSVTISGSDVNHEYVGPDHAPYVVTPDAVVDPESNTSVHVPAEADVTLWNTFDCVAAEYDTLDVISPAFAVTECTATWFAAWTAVPVHDPDAAFTGTDPPLYDVLNEYEYAAVLVIVADLDEAEYVVPLETLFTESSSASADVSVMIPESDVTHEYDGPESVPYVEWLAVLVPDENVTVTPDIDGAVTFANVLDSVPAAYCMLDVIAPADTVPIMTAVMTFFACVTVTVFGAGPESVPVDGASGEYEYVTVNTVGPS